MVIALLAQRKRINSMSNLYYDTFILINQSKFYLQQKHQANLPRQNKDNIQQKQAEYYGYTCTEGIYKIHRLQRPYQKIQHPQAADEKQHTQERQAVKTHPARQQSSRREQQKRQRRIAQKADKPDRVARQRTEGFHNAVQQKTVKR